MKKVTGIGGIFFKSKDPKRLKEWYVRHLGLPLTSDDYIVFSWGKQKKYGHSVLGIFDEDTKYFNPSEKSIMINFRVQDIEKLLEILRSDGVEVAGDIEEYEYGKVAWIMDKIELWEPDDEVFRRVNKMDNK